MISREIGWSNQNNLTFGIIQQVNKIQKQVCCNCNITTTTTSSSTSTTTSTSSSTTTTTTTLAPALRFTTDIVPEKQEFCLYIQTVGDGGPAINYVLDFGTGDISTGSIAAGTSITMSYTYPLGSYESVMTFDTPARILQFNMNCGSFKINTITGLEYLSGLTNLDLQENNLTTIDVSQNTNLVYLDLSNNLFTDVNNLVFPNSIMYLLLAFNQISNFNPINPLPSSLTQLYFNYNQIVTFNPTLPLPSGLQYLFLSDNQMTTAGYTASEPWANAMTNIPGREIWFINNVNSAIGTNLQTILISKGWNVYG